MPGFTEAPDGPHRVLARLARRMKRYFHYAHSQKGVNKYLQQK